MEKQNRKRKITHRELLFTLMRKLPITSNPDEVVALLERGTPVRIRDYKMAVEAKNRMGKRAEMYERSRMRINKFGEDMLIEIKDSTNLEARPERSKVYSVKVDVCATLKTMIKDDFILFGTDEITLSNMHNMVKYYQKKIAPFQKFKIEGGGKKIKDIKVTRIQ